MDLNMNHLLNRGNKPRMSSGYISALGKNDNMGNTALSLDCSGFEANNNNGGTSFSRSNYDISMHDDGCKLVLGLGPTPTSYCTDYLSGITKSKERANEFKPSLVSGADSNLLKLGLSIPIVDEGSSSAKRMSGGYIPSLLFAPRAKESDSPPETYNPLEVSSDEITQHNQSQFSSEPSATTDSSFGGLISDQHRSNYHPKKCRFKGCSKGARGASGLCIAHGGGQRCQKAGCNKGAESRTAFCKAHGGGRRCQHLGCTKSAEGRTDFCIAHGGGRRCGHHLGCTRAARGKSGLCIRHGGGKRCTVEGCTRSAEGQAALCISHGGGRRCQFPDCGKGAQGSTSYCKAHGGGKRCVFEGCTKGAEGSTPLCKGHGGGKRCRFDDGGACPKSVHGGTNYCVAHGGGKRCAVPGCTKSARGRTDCCVKHGGGRRCRIDGCGKSAQGSTDFCKAHGGGKRCRFGRCEKFARGKSGLCASHGSKMTVSKEGSGGMIGSDLFKGVVPSTSAAMTTMVGSIDRSSSGVSAVSYCVDSVDDGGNVHQLMIPPQVLVPMNMKGSGFVIPEGRVHGGGLMYLLGGSIKNACSFDGGRI